MKKKDIRCRDVPGEAHEKSDPERKRARESGRRMAERIRREVKGSSRLQERREKNHYAQNAGEGGSF